jgi:hypothetical protein
MDDGWQSDFLFAKLRASRLGMRELLADAIADSLNASAWSSLSTTTKN